MDESGAQVPSKLLVHFSRDNGFAQINLLHLLPPNLQALQSHHLVLIPPSLKFGAKLFGITLE